MGDEVDSTRSFRGARINVVVAALLMVATLPGRSHGLGLLTEPILKDFQIDGVQFGFINLWASLLGAMFCLPCGWLIDRFGLPPVMAAVVVGLGVSVLELSAVQSVVALTALLILIRGFGQSALSVVSLGVVGKTVFRRREIAMAVYAVLMGVGFAAAVYGVKEAEKNSATGWRDIWNVIGYALLIGVLPVSLALLRPPEMRSSEKVSPIGGEGDYTLTAALRTSAFWAIALTCALFLFISSGTALFYESVLKSFGFGRPEYEEMLGLMFLLGVGFNLLSGWLAQRWSMTRMLGAGSFILAGSLAALPYARTMSQLYWYAAAVACSGGVVTVVFFIVWRQMYGAANVGQIQGAAQLLTVIASAVSVWLFPAAHQWFGSYIPLLQVLAVAALALGVWVWIVPLPRRYIVH